MEIILLMGGRRWWFCAREVIRIIQLPPKSSPCIWSYECVIQFNWFESDFNIVSLSVKPFSLKTHQRVAPRLCNPNAESSVEVIATVTFVRRHIQPTIIHQTLLLASHHPLSAAPAARLAFPSSTCYPCSRRAGQSFLTTYRGVRSGEDVVREVNIERRNRTQTVCRSEGIYKRMTRWTKSTETSRWQDSSRHWRPFQQGIQIRYKWNRTASSLNKALISLCGAMRSLSALVQSNDNGNFFVGFNRLKREDESVTWLYSADSLATNTDR